MDEKIEEKSEKDKSKKPTEDTDEGDEHEEDETAKLLDAQNERITKLEEDAARRERGGEAEAGLIPPKPEPETDDDYAERVRKGEANPLKEDGFIR